MKNERREAKRQDGRKERITSISVMVEFSGLTDEDVRCLLDMAREMRECKDQSERVER